MFLILFSDRETLLWLLTRCFLGCKGAASVGPVLCQQWLLELMGHVKALATGMTAVPEGCQLAQVTHLSPDSTLLSLQRKTDDSVQSLQWCALSSFFCFFSFKDYTWLRTVHDDHYVTGMVPGAGISHVYSVYRNSLSFQLLTTNCF